MADEIRPVPAVPQGLREASQVGALIPFIGAGASRLAGCPGWGDFADGALRWLIDHAMFSYSQFDQIRHLNPRVKLSLARMLERENSAAIDYKALLHPRERQAQPRGVRLYNALFKLASTFVRRLPAAMKGSTFLQVFDHWFDPLDTGLTSCAAHQNDQEEGRVEADVKSLRLAARRLRPGRRRRPTGSKNLDADKRGDNVVRIGRRR
jgi:hypothetical protein